MKTYIAGFAGLLLACLSCQAAAQETAKKLHQQLEHKHTFIVGGFRQEASAEFYADANNLPRAGLSLGALGLDNTDNSWMAEYRYRLNQKWLFAVGAYTFETSGSRSATRDFVYDGVEYQAGASVRTNLQADTYIAEAMYKVYESDRAEMHLGGGLHVFDFSAELKVNAFVGEAEGQVQRNSNDILAPLPHLRLQGFYALSPKWGITGTLGWFSLNYEEYDGSFAYVNARVGYKLGDNFGVGLGYQYVDIDFSVERDRGEAGFDMQFNGPSLHLHYSF
jgi:hypothetical protein